MSFDYLTLIFKDIKNRKVSSFLTLFAISLGILAIYVILLVSMGFENTIEGALEEFGGNKILVQGVTQSALTDDELNYIRNRPYIEEAFPFFMERTTIEHSNEFKITTVVGSELTDDFWQSYNQEIELGRAPRANERYAAVIGPTFAEDFFEKELSVGSNVYINGTKFKVVGIFESFGNPQDDNSIMVNIDTLRDLYNRGDRITMVQASVIEGYDVTLASENLQQSLDNRVGEDKISISTAEQLLGQFKTILNIVNYTLGGIALVALLVGAFGIINMMYVIVSEKVKDIGIMKSVGARNEEILLMYMFQAGLFGFLGALLGVILGALAGLGFGVFAKSAGFDLEITITAMPIVALLVFGFLIGVLSGYLPARQASRLNIIESLRK